MGQGVFAHRHKRAHLFGGIGEPEPVLEVALVLAQLLGQTTDAVAVLPDHPVVHRGLIERREVLALQILDDRDLECRVVVELLHERRDRAEPGSLRRAPAALTGDELEPVAAERPHENGLQHAVLADRRGELIQRFLVDRQSRLLGVWLDLVDGDMTDTDAATGLIR